MKGRNSGPLRRAVLKQLQEAALKFGALTRGFMDFVLNLLAGIGAAALGLLQAVGRFASFSGQALYSALTPPWHPRQIGAQLVEMAYFSLPVIGLTGLFTGMVLALQSHAGLSRLSAEEAIPQIVALSITRELGPVVAGLMFAGRMGSSIAAELSTMRVNEQVDALKTLSVDPWRYLVAPRLIAALIALPLLVLVADVVGIGGGYLVAVFQLDFNGARFLAAVNAFIEVQDWAISFVKALVFGLLVALFGAYMGLNATGGAAGVGRASTNAVVAASIALLVANLAITQTFFRVDG